MVSYELYTQVWNYLEGKILREFLADIIYPQWSPEDCEVVDGKVICDEDQELIEDVLFAWWTYPNDEDEQFAKDMLRQAMPKYTSVYLTFGTTESTWHTEASN